MLELIRGKVARILNSREVVLNVGWDDGVNEEMQFDILAPELHDIKDPDSHEVIGHIQRPKIRVKVGAIEDRFCIAHTFRTQKVNIGGLGFSSIDSLDNVFKPPEWVTRTEVLKTKEDTWENLTQAESFVSTGDPVVQVVGYSASQKSGSLKSYEESDTTQNSG